MKRLLFAAALLIIPSLAGAYELSDVVGRMKKAETSFKAIGFDFSQDVQFTQMKASSTITGRALFAQPNRMRIEKLTPEKQLTVSNGKTLWVYNPTFNQVWKGSWKSWVDASAIPQGLVPAAGYMNDLQKRFQLTLGDAPAGFVRVVAQPKDPGLGYALELVVSTDTWIPAKTVFKSDTAVVVTSLTGVSWDAPASDAQFNFKAPAGADVIPLN